MEPHWQATTEAELLRAIEVSIRTLVWQNTRDGQKGMNRPEPWHWPWERPDDKGFRGDPMTVEEALDFLGWTREMYADPNRDTHQAFPDDDEGT
jgi:Family of unknown function (DUF5361)